MTDPALKALREHPAALTEQHIQAQIKLPPLNRHVLVSFPVGMTDFELMAFLGWATTTWLTEIRKQREAPQSLILPRQPGDGSAVTPDAMPENQSNGESQPN